jgi:serine/threonine protein kinase/tetratricopeptide (TPR) repeat protein
MSDPSQRDPSSETPASAPEEWARTLDAEAMRRRIGARLFGDAVTPTYLGRFRVLRTLGVGGIGVVYAAEDDLLHRVVALKMIRDEVLAREGDRQRILSEARALARLSHPNVVQLHEVVSTPEAMFLVMEYVEGTTLLQWSRAERRSVAEILAVFASASRGLVAAHRADIVHRDIKPGNILIGEDGRVRIVDFGLARRARPAPLVDEDASTPVGADTPLSQSGATSVESGTIGGTPAYMAPEAFIAGEVDARSDQFSFCVTLYESLYGVRPFGSDTLSGPESLRRAPTFPAAPLVPAEVRRLLARGLSARPAERFASMDEVTAILEPRPRSLLLGLVAVLLLGALVGTVLSARGAGSRCVDPVGKFVGMWDDEGRESMRRGMLLSGKSFAGQLVEPVAQQIDRYVESWRAAHLAVCEASAAGELSSELLDRSMICLEQSRLALVGLVDQLERGDPYIVSAALELTHDLPDIAVCRDSERMRSRSPRSEEPRLAKVRSLLMEATAREWSGEASAAAALAEVALREARAIGDRGIESEVLQLRGRLRARDLGELAAGRLDLHDAIDRAADAGDDALAAYAWVYLAEIAALVESDADGARQHLAHAREAIGRHGSPAPADEARLLDVEGSILWLEEDFSTSLQLHRQALALLKSALPADHPGLLRSHFRVINATADAGDLEAAVALAAEVREEVERKLGAEHPAIALIEFVEAQHLAALGRSDEARLALLRVRPHLLHCFGARTPHVAMVDLELARIEDAAGELPRAIGRVREALRLIDDVLPPRHNLRIEALALLANYYHRANDCSGVIDTQGQLLALHEEGAVELELSDLLYNLGDCQCRLGRCARGYDHFIRLLSLKPTGARRALALYGIAFVHIEDGQPLVSLPLLKEARELLAAEPDALPFVAVDVARLLARALEMLHREPRRVRALRAEADALARKLAAPHAG